MGRINVLYGLALYLLNSGKSAAEMIGYVSLTYVAQLLDFAFVTKDRDNFKNQDASVVPILSIVNGLAGYVLLKGDSSSD